MPQVSLYLDQDILDRARQRAKIEKLSLSKYVAQTLSANGSNGWPEGYWDLFGSLTDETFVVPEDIPFDQVPIEVIFP